MLAILFDYNGRKYQVSLTAYEKGRIVLPNGTVLDVIWWNECEPPIPMELVEVHHCYEQAGPSCLAKLVNGELAQEA